MAIEFKTVIKLFLSVSALHACNNNYMLKLLMATLWRSGAREPPPNDFDLRGFDDRQTNVLSPSLLS